MAPRKVHITAPGTVNIMVGEEGIVKENQRLCGKEGVSFLHFVGGGSQQKSVASLSDSQAGVRERGGEHGTPR